MNSKTLVHFLLLPMLLYCFSFKTIANSDPDVWEAIRNEFSLNHEINHPDVQEQIRWLLAHSSFLQKASRQSEPYIYHIISELKKRHLPGEFALLPMIESAYDPFAYSRAGAAGLWQLMPGTARDFGVQQNWWFEGRRSIPSSTAAALNYLIYLNKFFKGSWILAIAAYDAGQGTLANAIKTANNSMDQIDFWNLNLPKETKIYVPRLFALAEIIQNPERYNLILPKIPYLPYFKEIDVGSPIDLSNAAKLAGISYKELIRLNPGYNRWSTAPHKPFNLLIPKEKKTRFLFNLSSVPVEKRVSWIKHSVVPGDNLNNIALRYHTSLSLLKQINQLNSNQVKLNQLLLIPSSKNIALTTPLSHTPSPLIPLLSIPKNIRLIHIVQPQDTFEKIQKMYRVSPDSLKKWNQLASSKVYKGQQLIIWKTDGSGSSMPRK